MTRVLVTGANGFAGSHILEALMDTDGVEPIAACRNWRHLLPTFDGEVRVGDLRDPAYLDRLLDGVDVVCHAAAWTAAWGFPEQSNQWFLQPSLALVDRISKSNVSRFIFLSSTSVAAPDGAGDAIYPAMPERLSCWPHMQNMARIENVMHERAHTDCSMVSLRVGLFAGQRYGVGLLPLLIPRLKTHLVPWVGGGKTSMPIVSGSDVGKAFSLAAKADHLNQYESLFIVGPSVPTVREVINFLYTEFHIPKPHFGVPFFGAYLFARLMELIDPVVPWEPLVTRSIVHLLEETRPDNTGAHKKLGYQAQVDWKDAIRMQMKEMSVRQKKPMRMHKPMEVRI